MVASKIALPKEVKVTGSSIMEYTEALRDRYFRASKGEKGKILDDFTKITGDRIKRCGNSLRQRVLFLLVKKTERRY